MKHLVKITLPYNPTKVTNSSQASNTIPWNLLEISPTIPHPVGTIQAFTKKVSRVLNTLLLLCSRYKLVYVTHKKIAKMSGCSVATVKRCLDLFKEYGFIAVKNNGANKSCWYKVSKYFNNLDVIKNLKTKLPIFFYFCINLITSTVSGNELRCINDSYLINKTQQLIVNTSNYFRRETCNVVKYNKVEDKKVIKKQLRSVEELERLIQMAEQTLWSLKNQNVNCDLYYKNYVELKNELKEAQGE